MKRALLSRLIDARRDRCPVALVTDLATGLQTLVFETVIHGSFGLDAAEAEIVRRHLRADRSGIVETGDSPDDGQSLFVRACNPPLRLIVVGAVHIAQALVPMAALAGYDVTVVDPRRAFATDTRFPGVVLRPEWPEAALAALAPDGRTAVVTLGHAPKLDDPALAAALRTPAFHIGALGSRKTHARRLERLREQGFAEPDLARIHAPVGLAIGATTPAEIAIAILAEMTAVRHGAGLVRAVDVGDRDVLADVDTPEVLARSPGRTAVLNAMPSRSMLPS